MGLAIGVIKQRLENAFGKDVATTYRVVGEPTTADDADALARANRYEFQWWALDLVGACPAPEERKKGADKGIDGRLFFHDDPKAGKTKTVVISVKSGNTSVRDVRDLRGVVEREKAEIGVLILLHDPTKEMRVEATAAGWYRSPWAGMKCPRLQILTIEELLAGDRIDLPESCTVTPFRKKAPRVRPEKPEQGRLFGEGAG
jgi:site-specific DNA-methyltransferase (adenine-specific)